MSLDMYGFIDTVFDSPVSDVKLITQTGDYTGPGGTWESTASEVSLRLVNIQPASLKSIEALAGGVFSPTDWKMVHINDGTMIYPDDEGKFSDLLEFSDGRQLSLWRVKDADCRPHRNFCKVMVERYRGADPRL